MKKVEWEEWADSNLLEEVRKYGKFDTNACLSCGGCTIICPLSSNETSFSLHRCFQYVRAGLRERLLSNLGPWLCYYCGDCSTSCPRQADPGETMMTLRRYLTANYDWTGLSKRFYTSKIWEIAYILFFAALVIVSFVVVLPSFGISFSAENIGKDGGVLINSFAPWRYVEIFDWTMAAIVATLLISNILRMYYYIIWKNKDIKVSFATYIREFWVLLFNFAAQPKFSKCNDRRYWLAHWLLMSGYTIMFIVIVVYLEWFQTDIVHKFWHPQRLLGYYATLGLLFGLFFALIGRLRKKDIKFQFSHVSDWLFLVMLTLTVISGILIHIFRINGYALATYIFYIVHMAVLVPMILIEVPFSKWSHLAYRPFAIYFYRIKEKAFQLQQHKEHKLSLTEAK
ncbi:MAG: 4Fe-4S ferredoxin [Bacteroidales bacterium]|nr:4Fe-4S ferredoxin [Bacteroidales bacterium]